MSETTYEIHILEKKNSCPKFYVIDCKTGMRYPNWHWPPEFEQLGCDYVNEHCKFVVDYGYAPEFVKSYFVDASNIMNRMNIFVELTEAGEKEEKRKYREKLMYDPYGFGFYSEPSFYHPPKKD